MARLLILGIYYGGWLVAWSQGAPLLPDFSGCFIIPPECPNSNISFWLYNREISDQPYLFNVSNRENLSNAPLAKDAPVVVLIHGYTGYRDYSPNMELRPAYLNASQYNLISLDYGKMVKSPCYIQAAYNVDTVGNCTAIFLRELMMERPDIVNLDNLHIVGFSLGAQVAGAIGKYMKAENMTIKWMTGLDPALPLFDSYTVGVDGRLDETDADFLDVMHTAVGNKGVLAAIGTVDFYLNSAFSQPGCNSNSSCDHVRAVEYYAESLSTQVGFYGAPCEVNLLTSSISGVLCQAASGTTPTVLMGANVSKESRGSHQVITESNPPFAKGMDLIPEGSRHFNFFG